MPSVLVLALVPKAEDRAQKTVPFQAMAAQVPVLAMVRWTQVMPSVLVLALVPDALERAQNTVPFHAMPCHDPVLAMVR